jgi:hypothetical protein
MRREEDFRVQAGECVFWRGREKKRFGMFSVSFTSHK